MQPQIHVQTEAERQEHAVVHRHSTAQTVLNFAALGCLLASALGILKALEMERVGDGLICLLGSLVACGLVCYLYFRND
jgi:predicted outer membrane lipoprotein